MAPPMVTVPPSGIRSSASFTAAARSPAYHPVMFRDSSPLMTFSASKALRFKTNPFI